MLDAVFLRLIELGIPMREGVVVAVVLGIYVRHFFFSFKSAIEIRRPLSSLSWNASRTYVPMYMLFFFLLLPSFLPPPSSGEGDQSLIPRGDKWPIDLRTRGGGEGKIK